MNDVGGRGINIIIVVNAEACFTAVYAPYEYSTRYPGTGYTRALSGRDESLTRTRTGYMDRKFPKP